MRKRMKKAIVPRSEFSAKSIEAIGKLQAVRGARTKAIAKGTLWGTKIEKIDHRSPLYKKVVTILAQTEGLTTSTLGVIRFARHARKIREATKLVGKALVDEALWNKKFRDQLNRYRYVFVNWEGDIVLTNRGRIPPFGAIRLKSIDILLGRYQ